MLLKYSKDDILKNEPYSTFIKKFDKLPMVINEKIHMKINSVDKDKRYCSVVNKKDTISNDFLAETNSYAC